MKIRPHAFALAGVIVAGLSAPAAASAAEAFFGATSSNTLVTFASDSPGTVRTAVPISGLQAGEQVLALDMRPATGQLYALGSTSRLYAINPASGAARAVGDPFTPPLAGTSFGFDFNPAVDRIRLTSDGRQNLRLNPETGAVVAQDGQLAYADGDPGQGANPHVGAAAYTPEAAPRLFAIDSSRDVLVLQDPPNEGRLTTVGPLNVDLQEPIGFDIAGDGRAFVAAPRGAGGAPELFLADLAKGGLSQAALQSGISASFGTVGAIAAAGTVPDDTTRPTVVIDADRNQTRRTLRTHLMVPVSCSEACEITAVLLRGREIAGNGGAMLGAPGAAVVRVDPNSRGKRLGKRLPKGAKKVARRLTLRVTVLDTAGNGRTLTKTLIFK
jgi:hypothetical protein